MNWYLQSGKESDVVTSTRIRFARNLPEFKFNLKNKIEIEKLKNKIKEKMDIIYIDPPYNSNFAIKTVEYIIEKKIADKNSTIIIETDSEEKILEELKKIDIEITDKRRYGRATLIFIKIGKG